MNPLLRRTPTARSRTPLRAEAPAVKGSGEVTLRLYDAIDSWGESWGVSAKEFVAVLDELPDDTTSIRLLVNSPGGEVWEGLAILNALRAHPARVTAVVEGIAASAASFIAAGVDELHMARNAELMIHRAWGLAVGNAEDMEKLARDLTHEDRNLASVYAAKSGGTVDHWLGEMSAETWYSDQEAVDAGLADRVLADEDGEPAKTQARARFDLSVLARSPRTTTSAASARGGTPTERSRAVAFTDDQLATMRRELGLAETADEQTIVDAMSEALAEQVTPPATPAPVEEAAPQPVAARLPDGVTTIDATVLAELQARAARGDEARTQQEHDVRLAAVNAAVSDGRIPASRHEHWMNLLRNDPGCADVLTNMAAGAVPVEPIGTTGGPVNAAVDDGWFAGFPATTTSREG